LKIYKNRKLKWNVLSSEAYQNQHKGTAALKVELEVKRKKKKEDIQRRQKAKRPKGRGLLQSAQSYCSTKSETRR
jgi:hypothetical protein